GWTEPVETPQTAAWWVDRVHPDDRQRVARGFHTAVDDPHCTHWSDEYRFLRKDGSLAVVLDRGLIQRDSKGKALRMVGAMQDITARRQASEALRQSEERFRVMADGTPIIIWVTDPSGRIRFINRTYREFFGVTDQQVITDGWQPLVHPDDHKNYIEPFLESLRTQKPFRGRCRVRRQDGTWRWIESYGEPLFSGTGQYLGMAGSSPDVTERKQFEAELERVVQERTARLHELVAELEHFSYSITHDMRAPLRAMRGFAEIVREMMSPSEAPEMRTFLRQIITSAERMDLLITDALNYSRTVRQDLTLSPVDMERLLEGMLQTYPQFLSNRSHITLAPCLPVVVGNEAGLTQCFSNLIGNA
ncbi:PAS domain-containing sensor histidine kinase, partial [bacterium]|nr:PAS domain-containing sensor histidine kinase [bacterium]